MLKCVPGISAFTLLTFHLVSLNEQGQDRGFSVRGLCIEDNRGFGASKIL